MAKSVAELIAEKTVETMEQSLEEAPMAARVVWAGLDHTKKESARNLIRGAVVLAAGAVEKEVGGELIFSGSRDGDAEEVIVVEGE